MLKRSLALVLFALASRSALAQTERAVEAERIEMYRRYLDFSSYVKGWQFRVNWMPDGNSFWYMDPESDNNAAWKVDPVSGTKTRFPHPQSKRETSRALVTRKGYLEFPPLYEIPSPDGKLLLRLKGHDLWLRSPKDDVETALTQSGEEHHEWGDVPWDFGAVWSHDSRRIAVVRNDYRSVPKIPIVDHLSSAGKVQWIPYPSRATAPAHKTSLFVIDTRTKELVRIPAAQPPYQDVSVVRWLPEDSEVVFIERDRYGRETRIAAADAINGQVREIVKEPHWIWPPRFLGDGSQLICMFQRDEWRQLYLYDISGKFIRQLTTGEFPVMRVVEVDEANGWVYFLACPDKSRPYDTHLCRVDLEGGNFKQLTEAVGQHEVLNAASVRRTRNRIQFSPSKRFFIETHSSPTRAPTVELRRADGGLLERLATANIDDLQQKLRWRPPEEFVVKATDGTTDLHGIIYKPYDFDPGKQYPVIHSVNRGAQHDFLGRSTWLRALAQLGFIVTTVDVRGPWTGEIRGRGFAKDAYGTFGRIEIPDHRAVVKQLGQARPYMDLSRVAAVGRSFGGYYAVRALLQAPDTFHLGIAIAPVIDVEDHANHMWLGPIAENRDEYEFASNLRLVSELKGRLFLIHGTADVSVPIRQTMRMVDGLVAAGKRFDLMMLPGWGHWGNQATEDYWMEACRTYLQEHLNP